MTEATAEILRQWGVAGALLIVAGYVIIRLWLDASATSKETIRLLLEEKKTLTTALADANAGWRADVQTMSTQLTKLVGDTVSGMAAGARGQESSTIVLNEVKQSLRDVTDELRRRGGR